MVMSLYSSKENTEYVVNILLKNVIRPCNLDDMFMAGMTAMVHIVFGVYILLLICVCKVNTKYYNITIFIWVIIIYSNYYFHGCLLTRLERTLTKNNNWFGPASLFLKIVNIEQTKNNANNFIKYFIAFPFSAIILYRIYLNNYYIFIVFFILLAPLLFISSQATLFNKKCIQYEINTKSIKDMTIIVSGASSGIGFEVVKELLYNGANVVCLMRNNKHSKQIYNNFKNTYHDKIIWIKVDYTSLKSVNKAVENIKRICSAGIDVLFNNAGVTNTQPYLTEDGYEAQIQINCISHIVLTEGILSCVKKRNGVIINHNSISYNIPCVLYNPMFFKTHTSLVYFNKVFISQHLYQQSKLGLLLYTQSLQRRCMSDNICIISFHPGMCKTNLYTHSILPGMLVKILELFSSEASTVVPYMLRCIVSSKKFNNKDIIYGPSNLDINKYLVNFIQVEQFQNDVVSLFLQK